MKQRLYIAVFGLLILLYLGLNLFVSPAHATLARYHISATTARVITFSVVIPTAIIYISGAYGSLMMSRYARLINKSKEGKHFETFSSGLLLLILGQVVTSDVGNIVSIILRHEPNWISILTIINNYLVIIMTGLGLNFIAVGAWRLMDQTRKRVKGINPHLVMFLFITLSSIYSYLIISQPLHTPLAKRTYYMPDWLVILTIAVPYLFIWYLGFTGAYKIYAYQKNIKGTIYRGSLAYVATGIAFVVLSSIAIRFLSTSSYQLSRLNLTPVLFIIYGFLVLLAIGYLLIAWGAYKLRRIEEV